MTESCWSRVHAAVNSVDGDKTVADLLRYLICDLSYNSTPAGLV